MRIILVSDIHGLPQSADWLGEGVDTEIVKLSAAAGAEPLSGEALHHHLLTAGGMETAVEHLLALGGADVVGLGFSAGGTALWRAVARGMPLQTLVCVSSTRLRLETSRLPIPVHTFWGGADPNAPDEIWRGTVPTSSRVYQDRDHGFYQQTDGDAARRLQADIRKALGLSKTPPNAAAL